MDLPVRAATSDETMQLYAAGFNAWNQLVYEASPAGGEPDDLFTFTKVLADKKLGRIVPEMTYTAVQLQDTWTIAGSSPKRLIYHEENKRYLFDLPSGISGDGKVLTVQDPDSTPSTQVIVQYPSLPAWRAGRSTDTWPCKSPVRQIRAYNAGFVILLEDETVLSCGDPRFGDCLGRDVDESCPANVPDIIPELSDLDEPIKKVAAGGYTVAALTESGALYLWGMETPGSQSRHNAFPHINELPNYFEVDGEKDVQDVAVGESHAIALTTDGCIYVVGDNTNGQIGLGKDTKAPVGSWSKIDFTPQEGWEVVAVEAGPRSSFIVTAKSKQSQSSE